MDITVNTDTWNSQRSQDSSNPQGCPPVSGTRWPKSSMTGYLNLCRAYRKKYPINELKELVNIWIGKYHLVGIEAEVIYINNKAFLNKLDLTDLNTPIKIPNFIFGFTKRQRIESYKDNATIVYVHNGHAFDKYAPTFFGNPRKLEITLSRPAVYLNYDVTSKTKTIDNMTERDEYNYIQNPIDGMFQDMNKTEEIILHNFWPLYTSLEYMFVGNYSLNKIDFGKHFNISGHKTMRGMFLNCFDLHQIDLGDEFDTSDLVDMDNAFTHCKLERLRLGKKFIGPKRQQLSIMLLEVDPEHFEIVYSNKLARTFADVIPKGTKMTYEGK